MTEERDRATLNARRGIRTVRVRVQADRPTGEDAPIWRFFGADEPNYATTAHGRALLDTLGSLRPDGVYFRAHNLLTSGDGAPALKWGSTGVYVEDAQGRPVYEWAILDGIFDTYADAGIKPYVQIGFMPEALSTKPQPYGHAWRSTDPYASIFTGWSYPPKDYGRWAELVFNWVKHCVHRYGRGEVAQWYWEVWNEPNIGYWQGTPREFHRLHDYAANAARGALPEARVGGPEVAGSGGAWMREFLDHCLHGANHATGATGTPLDFVSFHAKGSPQYVDGHVRMGIATHLRTVDEGFGMIASYPELSGIPVVIGESDPEGCAACQGPEMGYRNGTMYSSYTAACFARKPLLARRHAVKLVGALTWAFTFDGQPLFAGFRQLATGGIDLPVLNVFRMFARMTGRPVETTSDGEVDLDTLMAQGVRQDPDVSALASLDGHTLTILVWHYHDDDVAGPDAAIRVEVAGLPPALQAGTLEHLRIDAEHSNSYAVWTAMGSPVAPTPAQYERLLSAGRLAVCEPPTRVRIDRGSLAMDVTLPRQGVSLLVLRGER